jgi:hypothetical protein
MILLIQDDSTDIRSLALNDECRRRPDEDLSETLVMLGR